MRSYFLLTVILMLSLNSRAQSNIKHLKPKIDRLLTFDPAEQRSFERMNTLSGTKGRSPAQEKELASLEQHFDGLYENDIWDAESPGCSWYCGGGPYKVTASSSLASNGITSYKADNVHDLSYKTAWAEGVVGDGIGEYVEYHFKAQSPRITQIQIANGYVKTEKAWFENSRVKLLKMFVNGKPYAMLDLKDTRALQIFDVPVLGRNNGDKDWVLRFEIAEVYKGDKYDDTVISELFFDGTDMH